jgi:voltage-gated potassium channel Kch
MVWDRFWKEGKDALAWRTLKGAIMELASGEGPLGWNIETMLLYARENASLQKLLGDFPDQEVLARLKYAVENSHTLRDLTLVEFLAWVQEGGLTLYEQMVANPVVMSWLAHVWGRGLADLFEPGDGLVVVPRES